MKTQRTQAESQQIRQLIYSNPTFKRVFSSDWSDIVIRELESRLYGKIPRNFVLNIAGLIGTPTGIFKSTMGLQIAMLIDPLFSLDHRVAFSVNQLLDKVRMYSEIYLTEDEFEIFKQNYQGSYEIKQADKIIFNENKQRCTKLILLTKLVFFLDEQTKTLKTGSLVRLRNLIDSCRQRQICFITCGVESYGLTFSTFDLLRVQETSDDFLPQKRVLYAVFDPKHNLFYGSFTWDIVPLTNKYWQYFWETYSNMKTDFQRVAIEQTISSMNFGDYALEIIKLDDFKMCLKLNKQGKANLQFPLIKTLIIKKFPDLTNEERQHILSEIKLNVLKQSVKNN